MSIIIKQKEYELATEGLHPATITEVKDLGIQETPFGATDQIQVTFQMNDQKDKEGNYVKVPMKFTKSTGAKSKFRTILLNKLGIEPNGPFDAEELVGIKLQVVIEHTVSKSGKPWANVATVIKYRKTATAIPAEAEEV